MKVGGRRILICDCEGTMPLDGPALARACGAEGAAPVATQLCRAEIERFTSALSAGEPLAVACTQESPLFDEQRAEQGSATAVGYFDIRARAGWSTEGAAATPKLAALIAEAMVVAPAAPTLPLKSEGVTLIYGVDERALDAARQLKDRLDVTVLLARADDLAPERVNEFPVVKGRIAKATGHLGAFELTVDGYAQPAPSSRGKLAFGAPRNGARSRCDLILDLTGGTPLFQLHEAREGYLRPDPGDPVAVQRALFALADLVGEFDKPRYVAYRAEICAHSRSRVTGCTRCLDVCPTGAITPDKDHVAIDAMVCAGCGSCAAVCPTGAAGYALPPAAHLIERLRVLLGAYHKAGGADPVLLLHEAEHGGQLIEALARFGDGLPARVLPLAVNQVTQLGLEALAAAFAYGAAEVRVLSKGKAGHDLTPLAQQIGLCTAVMSALGFGDDRLGVIETDDPDALGAALAALPKRAGPRPSAFLAMGEKRTITKLALRALRDVAPSPTLQFALPAGAPFGSLDVDAAGCTLCLSCVAACPTGALRDDPARPWLGFVEDACVQCGLCVRTCPEKVIRLQPRMNLDEAARGAIRIKEEEPALCVRCGKPFGVKSSVERIVEKLKGKHWMYADPTMLDRMRMCADCRVIVQTEKAIDPYAGDARPAPKTTEDYLREREEGTKPH
jgi:ferredoxin